MREYLKNLEAFEKEASSKPPPDKSEEVPPVTPRPPLPPPIPREEAPDTEPESREGEK